METRLNLILYLAVETGQPLLQRGKPEQGNSLSTQASTRLHGFKIY